MRKSFEEVLALTADEFAAYFNSQVARALGQGGAAASLTEDEQNRIKEIRSGLYKQVRMGSPQERYESLEEERVEAAREILQASLDAAPGAAAAGGAGAEAAPVATAREAPSLAGLSEGPLRGIASYLPASEKVRLATFSKGLHTGLKKDLQLSKFLVHVARGQQDEAEAMLREDSRLLIQSSEFTDYSGRSFNCTAYEYAYWAKDTHMCRMLEKYMNEKAKAVLRERIDTMEAIDPATGQARGLVYWQNGARHQSVHFDLTPLITALQEYVNNYASRNWDAPLKTAWLNVGLAQREVPAHVAQEYCRPDRSFDPIPTFMEKTLPRDLFFYNYRTRREDPWYPLTSLAIGPLGSGFSLMRGKEGPSAGNRYGEERGIAYHAWALRCDLPAIRRLDEVRTAQLAELHARLAPLTTTPVVGGVGAEEGSAVSGGGGGGAPAPPAPAAEVLHIRSENNPGDRSKFLLHVARGQQDEAEAMLREDSRLLIQSSEFTDYSGRSFNCTAYEYAYWAKDTHMCRMLEKYMNEDAKAVLRERIDTMEAIDPATGQAKGLIYSQNGAQHQSAHFDLTPLTTALREYVSGYGAWHAAKNWGAIGRAWLKVGLAQREVPAHVAHEYCRPDRTFKPIPSFMEETLPRILSFYDHSASRGNSWYPLTPSDLRKGLGFDFALIRTEPACSQRVQPAAWWASTMCYATPADYRATDDLAAVSRLDEVRTAQLAELREHLNPPITSPGLAR